MTSYKLDEAGSLRCVIEKFAYSKHVAVRIADIVKVLEDSDLYQMQREDLLEQLLEKAIDIGVI